MNYTLYYITSSNDSLASLKYRGFKNVRTTISSLEANDQIDWSMLHQIFTEIKRRSVTSVTMVAKSLNLNNLSGQRRPFAL